MASTDDYHPNKLGMVRTSVITVLGKGEELIMMQKYEHWGVGLFPRKRHYITDTHTIVTETTTDS